jgi:hypothetical protein
LDSIRYGSSVAGARGFSQRCNRDADSYYPVRLDFDFPSALGQVRVK